MTDPIDDYLSNLENGFERLRTMAKADAERHNSTLPTVCSCGEERYVSGLKCPSCAYQAPPNLAWRVVQSDDFGFFLCIIGNRRHCIKTYHLDSEM